MQLVLVQLPDARRLERLVVEFEAVGEQFQAVRDHRAGDAHQVFLFDLAVLADQLLGDTAVPRQHQQAGRIDVEAPGRRQVAQHPRLELRVAGLADLALGRDQRHRRRRARLGLAGNVADRLVEQDRHLLRLVDLRFLRYRDLRCRIDARAKLSEPLTGDEHPAALDPQVGFAPRADAALGHHLRQAHAFPNEPGWRCRRHRRSRRLRSGGRRGCPRRPFGHARAGLLAWRRRGAGTRAARRRGACGTGTWRLGRRRRRIRRLFRSFFGVDRSRRPRLAPAGPRIVGRCALVVAGAHCTPSSSTSKTSVAFGGMTPPAPRAP